MNREWQKLNEEEFEKKRYEKEKWKREWRENVEKWVKKEGVERMKKRRVITAKGKNNEGWPGTLEWNEKEKNERKVEWRHIIKKECEKSMHQKWEKVNEEREKKQEREQRRKPNNQT